jgi:rRNA processing protein Gar1
LIIKATSQVPDGKLLVDENGRRAGRVMETIGPVSSPYISLQPMSDRIEKIIGSKVFVSEAPQNEISRKKSFQKFQKRKRRSQRGTSENDDEGRRGTGGKR